jgi:hypothetical protein
LKPNERERGQVLPLALVGLVAFVIMLFFMLNVGRLMIQRERARMRTDVTVMSGAVIYARCLNLYVAVKKADTGLLIAQLFPLATIEASILKQVVNAIKEGMVDFGPYCVLVATEFLAFNNGLAAIPFWNVKDLLDGTSSLQGIVPSFNVSKDEQKSAGPPETGNGNSVERYSYHKRSDGSEVEVEGSGVSQDSSGGAQGRSREKGSGKFVKREEGKAEGEHSLTLITTDSFRDKEDDVPGFRRLPTFYSVARARISGGNFDFLSMDSWKWGCFLAPVTVKEAPFSGVFPKDSDANAWTSRIPAILH